MLLQVLWVLSLIVFIVMAKRSSDFFEVVQRLMIALGILGVLLVVSSVMALGGQSAGRFIAQVIGFSVVVANELRHFLANLRFSRQIDMILAVLVFVSLVFTFSIFSLGFLPFLTLEPYRWIAIGLNLICAWIVTTFQPIIYEDQILKQEMLEIIHSKPKK
jgi:hypothetical protein